MRLTRLILVFTVTGSLAACATNPITGRSQLLLVSEESAIAQSAQAYQAMVGDLNKKGQISTDAKLTARVRLITDRLIDQAVAYRPETRNWAWSVQVIDDPKTVNAFCMAGGKMGIYTGLINKLNATDDEIAAVMGHEISHALLQHSREQLSEREVAGIGLGVVAATAKSQGDAQLRTAVVGIAATTLIMLPHSRQAETESDHLGVELAAKAGYNPQASVTLWEKMTKESGNNSKFDFLSTHPASPKRIDALVALQPQMMEYYKKAPKNAAPSRAWTSTGANERVIPAPQPQK